MILASPAADFRRPFKLSRNIQAMTRSQVRNLPAADQVVPRLVALFLLLARTGLRPGEALAFQCTDLDFQAATLQVARKTKALWRRWAEVPSWIFCSRTKRRRDPERGHPSRRYPAATWAVGVSRRRASSIRGITRKTRANLTRCWTRNPSGRWSG